MALNSVSKQIFAMGGGGFSMEPENLLLDRYILKISKQEKPKVCFIPTASGDSDKYIVRFYSTYTHLPLSQELISPRYAADDSVGLHFVGDRLEKIVSSRLQAKAYRVEKLGGTVTETVLAPIYLGKV